MSLCYQVEVVGYIARCFSHANKAAWGSFIVQGLFILVAPLLFAASLYMTLGRSVRAFGLERFLIVPVRILTVLFVSGDVRAFLTQAAGTNNSAPLAVGGMTFANIGNQAAY